jgi:hypothetical protein
LCGVSFPPPNEPDPTAPMPPYHPGQPPPDQPAGAPYAPGQASVPSAYPPSGPYTPGEPAYVAGLPPYAPGQPPYAPGQPPYAPGQPAYPNQTPASNRRPLLIIGSLVAALLVLCCGGGAIVYVALKDRLPTGSPTTGPITTAPPVDVPTGDQPTEGPTEPDPDPTTQPPQDGETFNMDVGDTVRVTERGDEWRVTVTNMQWRAEACGGLVPPDGQILVADVTFEVVEGKASINPLYFTWVGSDGESESTVSGLFTGCAQPSLQSGSNLDAGTTVSGKIAFDVTGSTTGVIMYEELLGGEIASWVAPAP